MDELRVRLPSLGVARITGGDAVSFMQAHFCNDVQEAVPGRVQLSGYCSPKGRLLAVFHLLHTATESEEEFLLVAPRVVLKPMLDRLSMFAKMARPATKQMFAQVTKTDIVIEDCSDELQVLGLAGTVTVAAASDYLGQSATPRVGGAQKTENLTLFAPSAWHPEQTQQSPTLQRMLCVGSDEAISALVSAASGVKPSEDNGEERWLLEDIRVGVPVVLTETQDQFVPQMANMHRLGGLSFTKGCYPGQEIVARMQYLGKLKRRTERFVFAGPAMKPGTVVTDAAGAETGVIMVAASSQGQGEALVVVRIASSSRAMMVRDALDGVVELTAASLPYTLEDPDVDSDVSESSA